MTIRGSCPCGAVSYEITGAFRFAGHCHCSMCRKARGAAFATWAFIGPQQLRWTSGEQHVEGYASSAHRERCFCRRCGSPRVATHDGNVTEVVLASVDGDPDVRPREHVFVGSRAVWHEITDPLPRNERLPPGMEP